MHRKYRDLRGYRAGIRGNLRNGGRGEGSDFPLFKAAPDKVAYSLKICKNARNLSKSRTRRLK